MAQERAKNYIERLPEIIERTEKDVSHLDPRMIEILYPERASREFTVTVVFGPSDDPGYPEAVTLAERAPGYRREGTDEYLRHFATYGVSEVDALHRLYARVSAYPTSELLVRDKRVPYAKELWLPFFWFFLEEQGRA